MSYHIKLWSSPFSAEQGTCAYRNEAIDSHPAPGDASSNLLIYFDDVTLCLSLQQPKKYDKRDDIHQYSKLAVNVAPSAKITIDENPYRAFEHRELKNEVNEPNHTFNRNSSQRKWKRHAQNVAAVAVPILNTVANILLTVFGGGI
jgi:hypothetical protein